MLGTSWFEITDQDVASFSGNRTSKIGYSELIGLLNQVIVSNNETPDVLHNWDRLGVIISIVEKLQRRFI